MKNKPTPRLELSNSRETSSATPVVRVRAKSRARERVSYGDTRHMKSWAYMVRDTRVIRPGCCQGWIRVQCGRQPTFRLSLVPGTVV
jgi:hypothetical protein